MAPSHSFINQNINSFFCFLKSVLLSEKVFLKINVFKTKIKSTKDKILVQIGIDVTKIVKAWQKLTLALESQDIGKNLSRKYMV